MTKNGIERNLAKSPYFITRNSITFFFSSKLHLNKFSNKRFEFKNEIKQSLSKRFKIGIDLPIICDLILYKRIETRGFLIFKEGKYYSCVNSIISDGDRLILKQ